RGIKMIRQQLDTMFLLPQERLERLQTMALLALYEGDFRQAASVLEQARALIEAEPGRLAREVPTILFLQGIPAFGPGESENCAECGCESSCIFPIRPQAVHHKPEGSRAAIRHFTAYLQIFPDDLGVRWLLNLAYMTLGEYPQRVPSPYLIGLEPFESEFDIG